MEKKTGIIILLVGVIIALASIFYGVVSELKHEHTIKHTELIKVTETQYKKIVSDSLTRREMKRLIDSLQIESIKDPKIVIVPTLQIEEGEKTVDTLYLPTETKPLYVSDYYPNKENPFVNYTLKDTIGKFKFTPIKMGIVLSETKEGYWQVDTKLPEYFEVTDIKAVGRPKPTIQKTSPFYIGGGLQKQNDKLPLSILGGFRVKRIIIIGGINTEKQVELKTLYNL